VSISNSQRQPFPKMNWHGTVYHGIPLDLYKPGDGRGNYLAFLGRICPEKRVDRAIEIAQRAEMKIKIAAKIDHTDREYMETKIEPLLDHQLVEFVGEVDRAAKQKLLGDAYALLFPIDWPEPFGLVMVESMACGTPVVAYRAGSVPEVIDPGLTGFIVESVEESVEALKKIHSLDRRLCREVFERRFSSGRMAVDYLKIYEKLLTSFPDSASR
ncbi:MAG: glycosyltransferase family 4 protein, partial [Candidatus Binatia bacterium]